MTNFSFRENHLFNILNSFDLQKGALDNFLRHYFRAHKALGSKDRRFISETVYGLFRWRGLLDYLCDKPISWEKRYFLYARINPLDYLHQQEIPPHVRVSFPKSFFELLSHSLGEEKAFDFCIFCNAPAPTTVRANFLKTTREELLTKWQHDFPISACKYSPLGITFHRKLNFFELPEFREGLFEIQDEASQLVASLVNAQPGDHVLDFCAGSGGKTLAFAPKMKNKGLIYLYDNRPTILEEAKKRLGRAGVHNAQIISSDDRKRGLQGKMHWVLVDAPCTGSGTLRRNPDGKWKFDCASLERSILAQRAIFAEALSFLRPDGHIVYATCSVLPQENSEQIAFFEKNFNLKCLQPPFQSFLEKEGMDGFFGAVLKRY